MVVEPAVYDQVFSILFKVFVECGAASGTSGETPEGEVKVVISLDLKVMVFNSHFIPSSISKSVE